MKKSTFLKIVLPILAVALVAGGIFFSVSKENERGLLSVSSETELYEFYANPSSSRSRLSDSLIRFFTLPFSLFFGNDVYYGYNYYYDDVVSINRFDSLPEGLAEEKTSSSDFSTTNVQVENVDEADIIKTDGKFLYSLSGSDVVITNVENPSSPKISSRISSSGESVPEELILSGDILTIISTETTNSSFFRTSRHLRYSNNNTSIRIFDISDRENPILKKSYKLFAPYYASRRIGEKLYVISSGSLRAGDGKTVLRDYEEDYETKSFAVEDVKYLKDLRTNKLTLISVVDLENPEEDISIEPFLLDVSNAYVSETAFYLLDERYGGERKIDLGKLFGPGGVIGYLFYLDDYDYYVDYEYKTEIYKFDIDETSEKVSYSARTSLDGETINQYSLDEFEGNLRVALRTDAGSYVAVLDKNLETLGTSGKLAKGERMYASRFLGDKAYLVTYKNTDPLVVIDLENPEKPKVLGELKIPGYSVYLHPYDETHLIGIGIDSEERTERDANGRVLWTSTVVTGMKMALFDVSNLSVPKEISKVHIGDSSTSSAILSNPKALLFSKEKNLLAIPVNNLSEEVEVEVSDSAELDDLVAAFEDFSSNYLSEGYLVYNLDLETGFSEKGIISHADSKLIRGAYIDDDLLTVSEKTLMINSLKDLEKLSELNLEK
ncbi:beta-propeller domain-containing protein [Candidatus Saccharibacteria bacterium]|nr:beta-propeller domain-containing protein [Candidatus Saccharibacteria bacterium]